MTHKAPLLNFERALARGHLCYDAGVGTWWENQANDGPHRRAYRSIVEFIRDYPLMSKSSPLILDYACGGGFVLLELVKHFPNARIVGVDGSKKMLSLAKTRLQARGITCEILPAEQAFQKSGPSVRLLQTKLPNFDLPQGLVDIAVFVFPNITAGPKDQPLYDRNGGKIKQDVLVGKMLARFREMDPEDAMPDDGPEIVYNGLIDDRVLARNIRGLLKTGGTWFKVDYANSVREELGQIVQWRSLYSEGALEIPIKKESSEVFFELRSNRYQNSKVIMDVYHQTRDRSDRTGGYFITAFEAVKPRHQRF